MGWETDLLDASFRGVQFDCTSTEDAVTKALSIKQAPYSNEASIEDMGNNPRDISMNAVYTGEDYKTWLDALEAALLATGSGELIHPVYGVQQVHVVSYNIAHSAENVDSCSIDIKFLLAKDRPRGLFVPVVVPRQIDTHTLVEKPASALEKYLKKLQKLDQNHFFTVVNHIRNKMNTFRDGLGLIRVSIDNVLSPAIFIIEFVDDLSRLVTFDASISAMSKWRDLTKRIHRFEKLFQNDDAPQELQQLWRATQVACSIAVSQQVVASVRAELSKDDQSSLTPIDLAVIRQQNRIMLQYAIEQERTVLSQTANALDNISIAQIQVFKQVADQVHVQIQQLIELRPPLSKTQVLVPCTLHWIAHQLYGDFTRANEIQRLNPDLINPAVLLPGMELTVYAQ